MSKSQVQMLLHVVAGILKDVRLAYPEYLGVDRDLARLTQLVKDRGLGVFTLDLPQLDDLLLAGLESGRLAPKGYHRYSKRIRVPRLFSGLWLRIFDKSDLCVRADADVNSIAFLRQLCCIGKKLEVPCSQKRELAAIEEYFDVERKLVSPTLNWAGDALDYHRAARLHLDDRPDSDLPLFPSNNKDRGRIKLFLQRCQRIADIIGREFGPYCPECFIEARRAEGRSLGLSHGPGAVAERGGLYDKYGFTNWSAKLEGFLPFDEYGKMPSDPRSKPRNHEVPARLICVPKTAKGPRIIAAEPSEHMFGQRLFATWFEDRIASTFVGDFIDLRDQSKSGKMVLRASRSGELATIDLSSASDRLSLWLVERIFRSNPSILRALHGTRTRWIRDSITGESVKLKKFASQGTAITFPMQSVVFLVIALASNCYGDAGSIDGLRRLRGKVRVYGDDIIVPSTGYAETVDLLTELGLKVNVRKCFSNGNFRESCGTDAYKGYDVTPIKPKSIVSDTPALGVAVIEAINNLFLKGYWYASEQLQNRQPPRSLTRLGVVGPNAGATGLQSYSFGTVLSRIDNRLDSYDRRQVLQFWKSYGKKNKDTEPNGSVWKHSSSYDDRDCFQASPESVYRLQTRLEYFLRLAGYRVSRINPNRHGLEVYGRFSSSVSRVRPFDCGYSGLLDGQLRPSNHRSTQASGIRGVPERPRHREVTRWVDLTNIVGRARD